MEWTDELVDKAVDRAQDYLANGTWLLAATLVVQAFDSAQGLKKVEVCKRSVAFAKLLFYQAESLRWGASTRRTNCIRFLRHILRQVEAYNVRSPAIVVDTVELRQAIEQLESDL